MFALGALFIQRRRVSVADSCSGTVGRVNWPASSAAIQTAPISAESGLKKEEL